MGFRVISIVIAIGIYEYLLMTMNKNRYLRKSFEF